MICSSHFFPTSRAHTATLRSWKPGATTHRCVSSALSGTSVPGLWITFVLAVFTSASKGHP